jgi:oligoendopeptidase F
MHIFDYPFYYIEYAIASLAAIAIRRNYLDNQITWIENYINLLKAGNTKTMPEIFADGWVRFDFTSTYIKELMSFLEWRIQQLYHTLSHS